MMVSLSLKVSFVSDLQVFGLTQGRKVRHDYQPKAKNQVHYGHLDFRVVVVEVALLLNDF